MIPLVAQFSRNRNTEYLPSAAHDERDRPTDAGGHFRIATLLSRQVVLTHYLSGAEAWDVCKGNTHAIDSNWQRDDGQWF